MGETTKGLAEAHRLLVEYSHEVARRKLKWWQIGRSRLKQMEVLEEFGWRLGEARICSREEA